MKSRKLWIGMMVLFAVALAAAPAALADDLPKKVDINISTGDSDDWYKNPVVIGGGVILLFVLAALAGRGGTTVVKN